MLETEIQKTEYFLKGNGGQWSSLAENKLIKSLRERTDSKGDVLQDRLEKCFSNGVCVTSREKPPASNAWQFVEGRGNHHDLPAEPFLSPQRLGVFCQWISWVDFVLLSEWLSSRSYCTFALFSKMLRDSYFCLFVRAGVVYEVHHGKPFRKWSYKQTSCFF